MRQASPVPTQLPVPFPVLTPPPPPVQHLHCSTRLDPILHNRRPEFISLCANPHLHRRQLEGCDHLWHPRQRLQHRHTAATRQHAEYRNRHWERDGNGPCRRCSGRKQRYARGRHRGRRGQRCRGSRVSWPRVVVHQKAGNQEESRCWSVAGGDRVAGEGFPGARDVRSESAA